MKNFPINRGSYSGKPATLHLPSLNSFNGNNKSNRKINPLSIGNQNPNFCETEAETILIAKPQTNSKTKVLSINQQVMSKIRLYIEKMKETCQFFIRFNHSDILQKTQLSQTLDKLQQLFFPFYRDALNYFIPTSTMYEEDKTFITSAPVRTSSFSFLQQWKIFLIALESIHEKGLESLLDLINDKFNIVLKNLDIVSTKLPKHTSLFELVDKNCSFLKDSLSKIQKSVTELFEGFTDRESENIHDYISEIKKFLLTYNDSFYNIFPKAGLLPQELSEIKSETLESANDIMNSIRALFDFWPGYNELHQSSEIIQSMLNSIIDQIQLPSSLLRLISSPKQKSIKKEQEEIQKKPHDFLKLEHFISSILQIIDKPLFDPNVDIWHQLKATEKQIIETIQESKRELSKIKDKTGNIHQLIFENEFQKEEIETLKETLAKLEQENETLKNQLSHTQIELNRCKGKINELKTNSENVKEKEIIEKVSTKLQGMMENVDESVAHYENEQFSKEHEIKSIEKLNVFVLEKRCSKCREFEKQRKELDNLLKIRGEFIEGESLYSIIDSLIKKKEMLEVEKKKISSLNEQNEKELQLIQDAMNSCLLPNTDNRNDTTDSSNPNELDEENGINHVDHSTENDSHDVNYSNDVNNSNSRNENDGKNGNKFKNEIVHPSSKLRKNQKTNSNIMQSFINVEDKYKKEIELIKNEMNENRNRELEELSGLFSFDIDENDEIDLKTKIITKIQNTMLKIEALEKSQQENEDLMSKIKNWMKMQIDDDINIAQLDFHQSFPILMKAIDSKENPLKYKVDQLEIQHQSILKHLHAFVNDLNNLKSSVHIETKNKNIFELLTDIEASCLRMNDTIHNDEMKIQMQKVEIDQTHEALQGVASRLHHLLQHDNDQTEFEPDPDNLMYQINGYVDELVSGGTDKLFVSISDINNISKDAKKSSKFSNSFDPTVYLPDILEKYVDDENSMNYMKNFEEPLEAIFKNFDFQLSSYNPDHQSFKFLREKIFQMHLLLGKEKHVDDRVAKVFKRFVSLSSIFFSYIAASFLEAQEREQVYSQNLKRESDP